MNTKPLKSIRVKSPRKVNLADARSRSWNHGYRSGAKEQKEFLLGLFRKYLYETGAEMPYGFDLELELMKLYTNGNVA